MLKQTGLTMYCAIIKNVKIQKYIFIPPANNVCGGEGVVYCFHRPSFRLSVRDVLVFL